MKNEHAVLVKGFKTQEQAEAFIKWYAGSGEQDSEIWFEECGFLAYTDDDLTFPIKTTTILDENHVEIDVSHLQLGVTDYEL